jgi:hypothetical protein
MGDELSDDFPPNFFVLEKLMVLKRLIPAGEVVDSSINSGPHLIRSYIEALQFFTLELISNP